MNLIAEIARSPVSVTTGTGGVGKTTISVAIAVALAQSQGSRVLVLTIDPARRLADVMSEKHLDHDPVLVDHSKFLDSKVVQGQLYAAMVDTQKGWEEIVKRYAKSEKDADRIFNNELFQNLTTRFSHSHDFVAMDQLYKHYRSGEYDFIVLDTPPTSKAFGFFDAPQALSDFFGGRMVRLVTSPYRLGNGTAAKIFDFASQPFFALADKILGKDFLNDIGEFFFLFHTMYDDFVKRANDITEFLTSKKVESVLVNRASQFISRSDVVTMQGLEQRNLDCKIQIINGVAFSDEGLLEVEKYLESADSKTDFYQFLESDLKIQKQFNQEKISRMNKASDIKVKNKPIIATVSRKPMSDEIERLKALVTDIQNLSVDDDMV